MIGARRAWRTNSTGLGQFLAVHENRDAGHLSARNLDDHGPVDEERLRPGWNAAETTPEVSPYGISIPGSDGGKNLDLHRRRRPLPKRKPIHYRRWPSSRFRCGEVVENG